jgi:hypothetical protein
MKYDFYPKTMAIRIPNLYTNLIAAETSKRHFLKKNGQGNENEFLNKMLPNMLEHRAKRRESLRMFLTKNIKSSITKGMQEKIIDLLVEKFIVTGFGEDDDECDDTVQLRFDVKRENYYAELFSNLDILGIKRSAYIRGLIREYFNQSEHERERICFREEYKKIKEAVENGLIVHFHDGKRTVSAFAVAVEFSVKREHWYVLYFEKDCYILHSLPLFKIKNVLLRQKSEFNLSSIQAEKVHEIIDLGDYDEAESFSLGGY